MARFITDRRVSLFAFLLLATPYAGGAKAETIAQQAAAPSVSSSTSAGTFDRGELLDAVAETIERQFVDGELLKRIEWRKRVEALRPAIEAAKDQEQVVKLISELVAELKTSHTALYTSNDFRYYLTLDALRGAPGTWNLLNDRFWGAGPYFPGIGVFTEEVDGKHFIDGVLEGSPAARAGLQFGDEIISVDGLPYSPVAVFRGKLGTVAKLEVRSRKDEAPTVKEALVVPIVPSTAFAAATQASTRVIEKNGRRIGYVRLWSVNEIRSFETALLNLRIGRIGGRPITSVDMRPLDGLIVDIRGRVGGNIGTAAQILGRLGEAPKPYWGEERRMRRGETLPPIPAGIVQGPAILPAQRFQGKSVLLVDHQTRSAGEIMAFGYQRSRFGPVIGARTAGAVSGGSPWAMPGDLMLYVAEVSSEYDGKRLEGVGVTPDIVVQRPLPYAGGADPVLDEAIRHLAGDSDK